MHEHRAKALHTSFFVSTLPLLANTGQVNKASLCNCLQDQEKVLILLARSAYFALLCPSGQSIKSLICSQSFSKTSTYKSSYKSSYKSYKAKRTSTNLLTNRRFVLVRRFNAFSLRRKQSTRFVLVLVRFALFVHSNEKAKQSKHFVLTKGSTNL